jgi:hypothetical protein
MRWICEEGLGRQMCEEESGKGPAIGCLSF